MRTVAGIADHYGWAAVVVVDPDGAVVDRRRAELIDPGLPASPIHHECQELPLDEAVALVHEVERSVERCAAALWDELEAELGINGVAIRESPELPPTIEEQISSYWAQTRADPVMYRRLLAEDAERRGWTVHHYDPKRVEEEVADALGIDPVALRETLGAPWGADQRRAFAAARLAQAQSSALPRPSPAITTIHTRVIASCYACSGGHDEDDDLP